MKPKFKSQDVLMGILLLGSLWGLIEVLGGGLLRAIDVPVRSAVVTALGLGIMAIGLAIFRKSWVLFVAPIIAVLVKQLAMPILHLSFTCTANSAVAVMLEGAALGGVFIMLGRKARGNFTGRAGAGFAGALLGGTAFWAIGMRIAPCPYLLSFNSFAGFFSFMANESLIWAALSALTVPLGYSLGESIRNKVANAAEIKPALYYSTTTAIVALSWGASAIALANGL